MLSRTVRQAYGGSRRTLPNLRMLFGLPRFCSASGMFADASVEDFYAILRKKTASVVMRMRGSTNSILKMIAESLSRGKAAYEGEGKMTVRIINQEQELGLMIDSYATYGFKLNNGITVLGPMAIFPRTVLSWQVTSSEQVTEDSLRLFKLLEPKIDLLVIGLESNQRSATDSVFRAARAAKINVELLPTEHACSTFNFLNAEGRYVAGALIPPLHVNLSEDDMLHSKMHYQNLYKRDLL